MHIIRGVLETTKEYEGFKDLHDQRGSNPGGWHLDEDGHRWYLKKYKSPIQSQTEYAALHLYEDMGFSVPWVELVDGGQGNVWIATKEDKGIRPFHPTSKPPFPMRTVFLPIVLLGDRDWNKSDNHFWAHGEPAAIDAGACFELRAMGESKEYSSNPEKDLETFEHYDDLGLYKNLTDEELRESLARIKKLSDTDIIRAFRDTDLGRLITVVRSRRDWLIAYAESKLKTVEVA